MTDQELLEAIRAITKEEIQESEKRIRKDIMEEMSEIKEEISEIKEDLEATKDGVNTLLNWAEECSTVLKFPLPRIASAE